MTNDELVKYWLYSSDVDFQAMETLFKKGYYAWALSIGRLVIEKLLRACYVKETDSPPPPTQQLLEIARRANLDPTGEQANLLRDLSEFKMTSEDPDSESRFYKKATRKYTESHIKGIVELRQWLIKRIKG